MRFSLYILRFHLAAKKIICKHALQETLEHKQQIFWTGEFEK